MFGTFDLDQNNDDVIDDYSMEFLIDGIVVPIETGDTKIGISNVNAVTRNELINLLVEDLGIHTHVPAFGPDRIFIASSTVGEGSSIKVKSEGTLASIIGFNQIADNVPEGKDGDTVTIGSIKYVFVFNDSSLKLQNNTNRVKVLIGATVNETAQNLASAINAQDSVGYTAFATNGVVTITAKIPGTEGNSILLSKEDDNNDISLSNNGLTGGQ